MRRTMNWTRSVVFRFRFVVIPIKERHFNMARSMSPGFLPHASPSPGYMPRASPSPGFVPNASSTTSMTPFSTHHSFRTASHFQVNTVSQGQRKYERSDRSERSEVGFLAIKPSKSSRRRRHPGRILSACPRASWSWTKFRFR